ncbi:MAG: LamG domain-containing protein [Candidatus Aenigmarchaeota archaeon]|nr:LamG domain-containing protein [Candidatus Aenigmarchaeota archaeon]
MRKILSFSLFFAFLFISVYSFALTCSLYSGNCPPNYVCLFSQYQENNSHVATCNYYTYKLCCQDTYLKSVEIREGCRPGEFSVLDLYDWNNSHVSNSGNGSLVLSLSFEEGSGDKVFDSSGRGNHGIVHGTPMWVNSKFGEAIQFDGDNDYVEINNLDVNTSPGAKTTVSFWMYWSGTDNDMPLGWVQPYDLWLRSGCFGFNTGESNVLGISSDGLANRWVHVVAIFYNGVPSPSTVELWIDGEKQEISDCLGTTSASRSVTSTLHIGKWAYTSGYYFSGIIDEVQIYNRALTEEEIKALYFKKVCTYAPMKCYLRNSCQADETSLISLYQPYNSHVGKVGYYSNILCCKIEKDPPKYLTYDQNTSSILPGHSILLYSEWKDNGNLSYAILSTNETGQWKNYTDGSYGSPLYLNHFWTFANFTWQNPSIQSGTIVAWRIYVNDSAGNWNVTPIQTFKVGSAISLEDTTGAISLKGWGSQFTFKVNVSNSNGYTTNVTLWKAYSSTGPWYYVDSQNCTNCLQENQLTFSDYYFTCDDFVNSKGTLYYKFNATDYHGSFNETLSTGFNVRKDSTSSTITSGQNSEVNRFGNAFVLLQVRIYDQDREDYLPADRNCSIYVGDQNLPSSTDPNGYCSINFDPDCVFSVGLKSWLGGINSSDVCYQPANSSSSNVKIVGQLFNDLEKPVQDAIFNNGDLVNITGKVISDCSNEGLISGATVTFEVKLNESNSWEECSPVDENNGWYNCTWDSTGKTGGWYDIRFNSSKTDYNPSVTLFFKRFYLNPLVQIEISPKLGEGILFTNYTGSLVNEQYPLDNMLVWNNATWNYNASDPSRRTEYWAKNTGTNLEDFCLKANSDLLCSSPSCTGSSIGIENAAWSNSTTSDPPFDTSRRLSLSYVKVAYNVQPNQVVYFRFWLNPEPNNIPSGIYNTTFSIKAVVAGDPC